MEGGYMQNSSTKILKLVMLWSDEHHIIVLSTSIVPISLRLVLEIV